MEDVEWLVKKIANLRVFGDENDVMNRSILELPRMTITIILGRRSMATLPIPLRTTRSLTKIPTRVFVR